LAALTITAICFHGSLVRAPAVEQGQAVEQESEKAEVDRTFRSYSDAFSRGDLSAIVKYCSNPLVIVSQKEVRVLPTAADVETFYGTVRQDLRERGYSYSKVLEVHVRLLGTGVALLSYVVTRYKTDDSELATFGGTYLFRKTEGVWKLAVITVHPAKDVIRAD
jgi:ketosteroid isomerase-like protein